MLARDFHRLNHLLAALPAGDYGRLAPHLEAVELPQGQALHGAGKRDEDLYFITSGVASHVYVTGTGASAESSLIGDEGVAGLSLLLGDGGMPGRTIVVCEGAASRLPGRIAKAEHARGGPFAGLMLRYVLALMAQTGQVAACNRHHSLEQRLCRWILATLDRVHSNELAVKHELIAEMLGVRRVTVSEAAAKLHRLGLVRVGRGHLTLLDRRGMEGMACECYAAIKHEYQRLLPGCCTAHVSPPSVDLAA